MFMIGIDEAGRGPIIGNLFVVGVLLTKEELLQKLKQEGVKDSKQLTSKRREELFNIFNENPKVIYFVEEIKPKEIDKKNINELEAERIGKLINKLVNYSLQFFNKKEQKWKIFVDIPEKKDKFERRLFKYLEPYIIKMIKKGKIILILEHKADNKYPVVSLASIFAKYLRDEHINKIAIEIGNEIGSGYPSDPITKKNLEKLIKLEKEKKMYFIRKKWSSLNNLNENISILNFLKKKK